jgi:hypothetical protein
MRFIWTTPIRILWNDLKSELTDEGECFDLQCWTNYNGKILIFSGAFQADMFVCLSIELGSSFG